MSLGTFLMDPLRRKTSLSRVCWLYGVVGSVLYAVIELFLDSGNEVAMRVYLVGGLVLSLYLTVATYQCAMNCRWAFLGRLVRVSALISLLLLPVIAYLEFAGVVTLTLPTQGGEL
ncbi:MAG TPA: hypothetical protein VKG63_07610 [Steroidobacteraceae bacterium]|nr:hypothetical protein [Steroidobacteraceae bacterium]